MRLKAAVLLANRSENRSKSIKETGIFRISVGVRQGYVKPQSVFTVYKNGVADTRSSLVSEEEATELKQKKRVRH